MPVLLGKFGYLAFTPAVVYSRPNSFDRQGKNEIIKIRKNRL